MIRVIKDVVRGTPVTFTATFYNSDDDQMAANTATLYVNYRVNNVANTANVVMDQVNTYYWEATWDSSNADAGTIDWSIVAQGENKAVSEGSFRVLANKATKSV